MKDIFIGFAGGMLFWIIYEAVTYFIYHHL
jgi:hypothetical protein